MPIYYTDAGVEEMLGRINKICDRLTEQTGVKWSTHTRVLIFNSLAATVDGQTGPRDGRKPWTHHSVGGHF